jgi:phage protein D
MIPAALVEVTATTSSTYGPRYQSLITGMADSIHIDPIRGTVGVEGRDLSASIIDSYRQQDFVNQTASEIVATIALYHGLLPIIVPTSGNIGRYYADGYTKVSLGQFSRFRSDWDLVVQLARENDYDIFVEDRTLYFQPSAALFIVPLPVSMRDVHSIRIERNLGITNAVAARVQSWSSQNMMAYDSGNAGSAAAGGDQAASAATLPFLFSASNYTAQQVTEAAERYAAELTRLGTVLSLDMPWDLSFAPRSTCLLMDTNSGLDTAYRIDSIERLYSTTSGSRQLIRAAQV